MANKESLRHIRIHATIHRSAERTNRSTHAFLGFNLPPRSEVAKWESYVRSLLESLISHKQGVRLEEIELTLKWCDNLHINNGFVTKCLYRRDEQIVVTKGVR